MATVCLFSYISNFKMLNSLKYSIQFKNLLTWVIDIRKSESTNN